MHILNTQIIQKHTNEGDAYSAADIPSTFTQPWLDFLKLNIGEGKYTVYTKNQQNRDDNTYHMTLVDPLDSKIIGSKINPFLGYPVHLKALGIGHIQEEDNEVYFLICECLETGKIRDYLNLPTQYFHITLGFKISDIFDKPKDKETLIFPYSVGDI